MEMMIEKEKQQAIASFKTCSSKEEILAHVEELKENYTLLQLDIREICPNIDMFESFLKEISYEPIQQEELDYNQLYRAVINQYINLKIKELNELKDVKEEYTKMLQELNNELELLQYRYIYQGFKGELCFIKQQIIYVQQERQKRMELTETKLQEKRKLEHEKDAYNTMIKRRKNKEKIEELTSSIEDRKNGIIHENKAIEQLNYKILKLEEITRQAKKSFEEAVEIPFETYENKVQALDMTASGIKKIKEKRSLLLQQIENLQISRKENNIYKLADENNVNLKYYQFQQIKKDKQI